MTISFLAFVLSIGVFVVTSFIFLFKLDNNYDSESDEKTIRIIEIILHIAIIVAAVSVVALIGILVTWF